MNTTEGGADLGPEKVRTRQKSGHQRSSPTIYDVATLAGVSASTVSRALNNPGRISAATGERVQLAARALSYQVNPMARALLTGRTKALGLTLTDITNPVFFGLIRGVSSGATSAGYTLLLAESQESIERELEMSEKMFLSVDGVLLVASRLSDTQILELATKKPIVIVNRKIHGVDAVVPDIQSGVSEALAHLSDNGHTSVAYLAGPTNSWMSHARWRLFLDHAGAFGLNIVEIGPGTPTLEGGDASVLRRVVASGVSAVITYNDLMAIGLLRSAQANNLTVPGDLSIIGFDDIFGSDFTTPPLTTIRTPLTQIGNLAATRLLHVLDHPGEVSAQTIGADLRTELIVRGSTGCPV